ncbi:lactonase family protein [Nibrella viscosa]|uniref:Lactonase family protein n=1 Tax=Nibrella viscosa TaxID=1084524 RepID=A0ABP8K842_9BACT
MKTRSIFLIFLMSLSLCSHGQTTGFYLYVGTYTTKGSEGIYMYRFDTRTGDATPVSIAKGIKNPSFLAISPNQRYLYAAQGIDGELVHAFAIDPQTRQLTLLNSESSAGVGPPHLEVDKTGNWVIVGNYRTGNLSVLPIRPDGSVGKAIQTIQHEGTGPDPERQERAHVHSINIAPNNRDVFVPDLGIDKIMAYTFNDKTGQLAPAVSPFIATQPGSGPRHFTFHPNGRWAYVIQELSSTITGYLYQNGTLKPFQTVNTLPDGYTGRKWSADVHISPDGRFLYGSNRAHESLVIFRIDPKTGKLSYVGHQDVMGKTPRNFLIDPTGRWVLVANQDTDNIVIFARDPDSGKLTPTGKEIIVSMPVCLKAL